MNKLSMLGALVCSLCIAGIAQAGLGVGDPAPKLSIKDWLKGEPVDPTNGKPDEVFIVEFWATWCGPCVQGIPHISEMQDHFKNRNVTFVGISNEKKSKVQKFMRNGFDSKMRYTVAIDDNNKTNLDWMKAAKQTGIPCAFVVKEGKIKWIGHPMVGLDLVVAELSGDKVYAEQKKKRKKLEKAFETAAHAEKWDDAVKAVEQILELDSNDFSISFTKYHLLVTKLEQPAEAAKFGREVVSRNKEPGELNILSWNILTHPSFDGARDLKLALVAAEKAMELSDNKAPEIIDTYARALADSGDLKGAIKWQKTAVELSDSKQMKRDLEKNLEGFEKRAAEQAS